LQAIEGEPADHVGDKRLTGFDWQTRGAAATRPVFQRVATTESCHPPGTVIAQRIAKAAVTQTATSPRSTLE